MANLNMSRDEVKTWLKKIELSKEWRKPYEAKWKRYNEYLQGIYFDFADDDQIAVNLVFPMVRVIIPSIYSRNPDVLVNPRKGQQFQPQAEAMYYYLKYLVKEIDLKEEIKLSLLDALTFGHGWVKQGYESEYEEGEETSKDSSILALIKEKFTEFMGDTSEDEQAEDPEIEYALRPNEKLVEERPWALRVSPSDMFVPAFSKTPKVLPWVAERLVLPLEDVKNNPRYKNTKELKGSTDVMKLLTDYNSQSISLAPTDCEYVVLYEIWDAKTNLIRTLADEYEKPLEVKENEYTFLDSRHPYTMLRFNEVPDEFYPMSDVEAWEPQIHELNKIRTQQSVHRKRYNRKYIAKTGAFEDDDLDDLKSGDDGTIVFTNEENLNNAIQPIADASLQNEVYTTEQRIKDDITEISGITGYQRGTTSQGAKTATEASIVESQSRSRVDERLDVVNTFVVRIIRNLAMISQNFMTQEQVYPILGDDQTPNWMQVGPDQIQGEFMYDIVYGSSLPINKEVDRQQFLQLYEMIANDPYYNPVKVREDLLRKFDVRDVKSYMAEGAGAPPIAPPMDAGGGPTDAGPNPPLPMGPNPTMPSVQGAAASPASIRAGISRQLQVSNPGSMGGAGL